MRITLNWLKKFLDTSNSLEEIIDGLFKLGLEVEETIDYRKSHAPFIVAEITHAEKHPNADSLRKCKVNNGKETIDIVCGAPNARSGIKVVLAPVGTSIPLNGMVIKESSIRGEKSQGMLCSSEELCLGKDSEGIIELGDDAIPGMSFIEYAGLNDVVIDISITPNRADCLGVYGIARDLAALGLGTLKPISIPEIKGNFNSPINVKIENNEECKYFVGRYIKNVQNQVSPTWLVNLLTLVGQKPISAIVDITNYINLSFARPLHAYDASKLKGDVIVKRAKNEESFPALNDEVYELTSQMTVVADSEKAHAIAGVIGGKESATEFTTKEIFLEAAIFPRETVIASGRKLQIDTDSRYRFERFVDHEFTKTGLDLAAQMVQEICGGEISEAVEIGSSKYEAPTIVFEASNIEKYLGLRLGCPEIIKIFESLGFKLDKTDPLKVTPPSWRQDITIKEDLIEEIARIKGFDQIPELPLPGMEKLPQSAMDNRKRSYSVIRKICASRGLHEAVTWSFMHSKIAKMFSDEEHIKLINPISSELDCMRKSIIPNLLGIIRNNEARSMFDMCVFEMGTVFNDSAPDAQPQMLAIARAGMLDRSHYKGQNKYDALSVKADLIAILAEYNLAENIRIDLEVPKYYHPAKSGRISLGRDVLGYFGELHPKLAKDMGIKQNVAIAEVFVDKIPLPKSKAGYKGVLKLSDFQPVERRFSFIINDEVNVGNMVIEARKIDKNLIKEVKLFDYVTSLPILKEGEKIAGLAVTLQSDKETLSGEQIEGIYKRIIESVEKLGAKFREV
ncbi:MAG: phenylalanine--tRNA ligase subunit beta [Sphingobacteriia bacterium]|nr:phenylalanine--tRNA ligase subunit beta [Sphingobacteriia bacterium]